MGRSNWCDLTEVFIRAINLAILFALILCADTLYAQSFNAGAGIVRSDNLGFDEYYGIGIVEASFNHPSIYARIGVELLDAEKNNQDGYGANLDITLTKPFTEKWGVLAFYRPAWIFQTHYKKNAHLFGAGIALSTEHSGRWDFYAGMSQDDYRVRKVGVEWRYGSGHWLRVKGEAFQLTHPVTNKEFKANRISLTVAPRIKW